MITTLTIIVIIAMLWLAWPRTPKVMARHASESRPTVMEFANREEMRDRMEKGDIAKLEIVSVYVSGISCLVTYRPPSEPQPTIEVRYHP